MHDSVFVLDVPGEQDDDREELLEAANYARNFRSMFLESVFFLLVINKGY